MNKMNNLNDHWLKGIILLKSSQNLTQFIEIRENAVFYGYWRCSFISNKDIGCVAVTIFLQFNNLFITYLTSKITTHIIIQFNNLFITYLASKKLTHVIVYQQLLLTILAKKLHCRCSTRLENTSGPS